VSPDLALGEAVELHPGEVDRRHLLEDGGSLGSLEREKSVVGAHVPHLTVRGSLGLQPGEVLLDVGSVDDHQKEVRRASVQDHVVERAALLVRHRRVLGLSVTEAGHVVRGHALEKGERSAPLDLELPHVGDVEQTRGPADRHVFGDEPRVLDGHLPRAERDHLGPALPVYGIEGCPAEVGHERAGTLSRPRGAVNEPFA
jgi:hypothetical protein